MKPITLALQCSDPPIRLTGTFPPTATLTEVLLHFEQESDGKLVVFGRKGEEAVVSMLGREFGITEGSGGGGGTTLAGMGVGGNVLVRLDFRRPGASSPALAPISTGLSPTPSASSSSASRIPVAYPPAQPSGISTAPQQPPQPPGPTLARQHLPAPQPQAAPSSPPAPRIVTLTEASSSSQSPILATQPPSTETTAAIPARVVGPGNRHRVVYSAASGSTPIAANRMSPRFEHHSDSSVQHDESLYNMTTEQAKGYQAYLSANVKAQSEKTLMTREMREAIERDKAAKRTFQECDVRIRFPDGTQVKGTFNSDETVNDIYAFVREQIASPRHSFKLRI